jgi:YHS domain-containing protein
MGRLILFAVICAAAYWYLKRKFRAFGEGRGPSSCHTGRPAPITDELVKDPVCGVYCPKREATQLYYRGRQHFFCSRECKQKFIEQQKKT